ncbi:MAG: methionyl-tRNA formyltransferase [Bacteroidia bacterium]|nr:methionyl-tRNA formyltransferase [Bacteroidia bacterium]
MADKKLQLVFMGTPAFAVASLKALVENNYKIVGVVTAPDKPAGRGQHIQYSPVKSYSIEKELYIMQPQKLSDPAFIAELKSLNPDLQIIVAFRFLPEQVWKLPKYGTFNLHASLLPQYRGAAPINWAIIRGETETGLTTFFIDEKIDTGKIILRKKVHIGENETAEELHDKLMNIGAEMVLNTVDAIESGQMTLIDQRNLIHDNEELKLAPKIFTENCKIEWNKSLSELHNFIRGLSPTPAAWTKLNMQDKNPTLLKIFETRKKEDVHNFPAGTILSDNKTYLHIAVHGGYLQILSLQMEGKKRMKINEFLNGFKGIVNCRIEEPR